MNAQEIYSTYVNTLTIADRLELARLIMGGLIRSAPRWAIQESDVWNEEDYRDLSVAASLHFEPC